MATPLIRTRVLIADDQPFLREAVRRLFPLETVRCLIARDGVEAVNVINGPEELSVLVIDYMMERLTGLEVAQAVRSGKTRAPRDLPILLVTAYGDKHVVSIAKALDVNGILVKPVSLRLLDERLKYIMAHPVRVGKATIYQSVAAAPQDAGPVGRRGVGVVLSAGPLWHTGADIQKRTGDGKRRRINLVRVEKLQAGMELAQNISRPGGALVAAEGATMTLRLISRLQNLAADMPELARIEVYSPDPAGPTGAAQALTGSPVLTR